MTDQPGERIATVFGLFADWCGKHDVRDLAATPGLYETTIGHFRLQLNAHRGETIDNVPPFHLAVSSADGFPLGLLQPFGGMLLAGAETDLIADLEAAIAEPTP